MSKATKRKHVAKEVLEDYVVPDPNQQIVKVRNVRSLFFSCSWQNVKIQDRSFLIYPLNIERGV